MVNYFLFIKTKKKKERGERGEHGPRSSVARGTYC